jgi:hypothetical protein
MARGQGRGPVNPRIYLVTGIACLIAASALGLLFGGAR